MFRMQLLYKNPSGESYQIGPVENKHKYNNNKKKSKITDIQTDISYFCLTCGPFASRTFFLEVAEIVGTWVF